MESRCSTINKLVELLHEDTGDLERQNDLLRKLPDLNETSGDLISNEDVCVANIHDSLGMCTCLVLLHEKYFVNEVFILCGFF